MIKSHSTNEKQAFIYMHMAVLLFGFTAILGNLILLPAIILVWWRVFLTSGSLVFFFSFSAVKKIFRSGDVVKIGFVGVIISLHWLCFYGAIKESNASIALICMSSTSFFTSIVEPLVLNKRFSKYDILVGFLLIPCFILITRNIPGEFSFGIGLGLGAALLAALFSVFNKKWLGENNVYAFTFIELSAACIFLGSCIFLNHVFTFFEVTAFVPYDFRQWMYILVLSFLCTTLAFILSLKALKQISAFTSNMIINLEPVYGIILAILLLGEKEYMNTAFYIGALCITLIVFLYPYLK
ncbi:MAG: EamA family transporter [Saprospiraceae bacterium]|nr:EamA family transporter [Saprospiraceae bacterium]